MTIIRRRMRKQVEGIMNPWNKGLEAGMRVFDPYTGSVMDLVESTGRNKRDRGELSVRKVEVKDAKPVTRYGVWYWERVV